jgi:hypothetical protein
VWWGEENRCWRQGICEDDVPYSGTWRTQGGGAHRQQEGDDVELDDAVIACLRALDTGVDG